MQFVNNFVSPAEVCAVAFNNSTNNNINTQSPDDGQNELTLRSIVHNGEDVDKDREAVEERQGLEAWSDGVALAQDEFVHDPVNAGRDQPGEQRRHEPRGN